jgi:uncharacterized protein YoaH (UPF0181 family)
MGGFAVGTLSVLGRAANAAGRHRVVAYPPTAEERAEAQRARAADLQGRRALPGRIVIAAFGPVDVEGSEADRGGCTEEADGACGLLTDVHIARSLMKWVHERRARTGEDEEPDVAMLALVRAREAREARVTLGAGHREGGTLRRHRLVSSGRWWTWEERQKALAAVQQLVGQGESFSDAAKVVAGQLPGRSAGAVEILERNHRKDALGSTGPMRGGTAAAALQDAGNLDELCTICFTSSLRDAARENGFIGSLDCCEHLFCHGCIWQKLSESTSTCPLCKREVGRLFQTGVDGSRLGRGCSIRPQVQRAPEPTDAELQQLAQEAEEVDGGHFDIF